MQHEKCATVAVGSGSRVPCPDNSDYPAMPPGRAMQPAHFALGAPLTFPFPSPLAKIQLILSANLLALFAGKK